MATDNFPRDIETLRQWVAALAPDWADAPDWAQWCVIHANGLQYWMAGTPFVMPGETGWVSQNARHEFYRELSLPIGVDWHLCKWQRP